jgi:hypothetical protein
MGPGEHPFSKFGHTALWLHDARANKDEVYNFGTFAFDSPTLLLDSVRGKLPYWLSVQSLQSTLESYSEQRRSLLVSELDLTPAERLELARALRDNALPQHRYYRYDYYRDNCATRVRDAVDKVLAGRVRRAGGARARMSYRDQTLRLVASDGALYVALDLAVGRGADAEIDFWDEAFLPDRLRDLFKQTTVLRAGRELPLVREERVLLPALLPAPASTPPNWRARYGGLGVLLGALFVVLGHAARTHAVARFALRSALFLLGCAAGLLGSALCYLTLFSEHSAAAMNQNPLLVPPWALALACPAALRKIAEPRAWRLARISAAFALLAGLLALCLHALSGHAQANGQELAFALPLWLGVAVATGFQRASRRAAKVTDKMKTEPETDSSRAPRFVVGPTAIAESRPDFGRSNGHGGCTPLASLRLARPCSCRF